MRCQFSITELDIETYALTIWDLDRSFVTDGLAGKESGTLREIWTFCNAPTAAKWESSIATSKVRREGLAARTDPA